jgi:hypothetical protein
MSRLPTHIREQERERAENRCEYCRKPEIASGYPHHVDHIIAVRHESSSDLDNLAWACFQCNSAKSSDIASYDTETKTIVPLFNPRQQMWNDHFMLENGVRVGKTPAGRVTIRTLQMNYPEQVETRRRLVSAGLWR